MVRYYTQVQKRFLSTRCIGMSKHFDLRTMNNSVTVVGTIFTYSRKHFSLSLTRSISIINKPLKIWPSIQNAQTCRTVTCTNTTWCVMSSVATQNIYVYMPHPNQITKEVLCDTSSIGLGLYIHALRGLWGKCSFSLKYTDTDSCYFNPLYTEFHFLEVLWILPYFHFCCELALETLARGFSINSLWVHDLGHTHSLASLQWSGLSDQWTLPLTENVLPTVPEMKPSGFSPFWARREENGPASAN